MKVEVLFCALVLNGCVAALSSEKSRTSLPWVVLTGEEVEAASVAFSVYREPVRSSSGYELVGRLAGGVRCPDSFAHVRVLVREEQGGWRVFFLPETCPWLSSRAVLGVRLDGEMVVQEGLDWGTIGDYELEWVEAPGVLFYAALAAYDALEGAWGSGYSSCPTRLVDYAVAIREVQDGWRVRLRSRQCKESAGASVYDVSVSRDFRVGDFVRVDKPDRSNVFERPPSDASGRKR